MEKTEVSPELVSKPFQLNVRIYMNDIVLLRMGEYKMTLKVFFQPGA